MYDCRYERRASGIEDLRIAVASMSAAWRAGAPHVAGTPAAIEWWYALTHPEPLSDHLRLWHDHQSVYCDVTDRGPGLPPRVDLPARRPPPGNIGGLGLWLAGAGTETITTHTGAGVHRMRLIRRLPRPDTSRDT